MTHDRSSLPGTDWEDVTFATGEARDFCERLMAWERTLAPRDQAMLAGILARAAAAPADEIVGYQMPGTVRAEQRARLPELRAFEDEVQGYQAHLIAGAVDAVLGELDDGRSGRRLHWSRQQRDTSGGTGHTRDSH